MAEPTAPLTVDAFLTAYQADPSAWDRLTSQQHLALFDEALGRAERAQARASHLETLLGQAREAARGLLALVSPDR